MFYVLSDALAPWGQAAGIILAIFLFVNILIGLVFSLVLMFGFAWVREKAELIKKIRPVIRDVNTTLESGSVVAHPAEGGVENKALQVAHTIQAVDVAQKAEQVHKQVDAIGERIVQGSDRVAHAVIELRARTVMVKGMAKAFFLPGLTRQKPRGRLAGELSLAGVSPDTTAPAPAFEEAARALAGAGVGTGSEVASTSPGTAERVESRS